MGSLPGLHLSLFDCLSFLDLIPQPKEQIAGSSNASQHEATVHAQAYRRFHGRVICRSAATHDRNAPLCRPGRHLRGVLPHVHRRVHHLDRKSYTTLLPIKRPRP